MNTQSPKQQIRWINTLFLLIVLVVSACAPAPTPAVTPTATAPELTGQIAFSGDDGGIWVMNADGSDLRQISSPVAGSYDLHPAFSPDGSRIAFSRETLKDADSPTYEIFLVDTSGGVAANLVDGRKPAWHSDARHLSYERSGDIYTINAHTLTEKNLTKEHDGYASDPAWSPDATKITFASSDRQKNVTHVWVMAADGSDWVELTNGRYDNDPTWSPEGEWIAYQDFQGTIRIMRSDGSDNKALTTRPSIIQIFPAFSPDGQWIAFQDINKGDFYYAENKAGSMPRPFNQKGFTLAWGP